jgi:hypothetical protein
MDLLSSSSAVSFHMACELDGLQCLLIHQGWCLISEMKKKVWIPKRMELKLSKNQPAGQSQQLALVRAMRLLLCSCGMCLQWSISTP